jgi:hypothetical protein
MEELNRLIAAGHPKRTRRDFRKEYERAQLHAALWGPTEQELAHSISEGRYERFLVKQAEK